MCKAPSDLTEVLQSVERGDAAASARLLEMVYQELRRMASGYIGARRAPNRSLCPTELVHEAFLRLFPQDRPPYWEGRAHFFGAAAEAMRRILIDRARARKRIKRGAGCTQVDLEEAVIGDDVPPDELLRFDGALTRLSTLDPRSAEIVKLRCYVGMSIAEVATSLAVSSRTINRDWLAAKAWLKAELAAEGATNGLGSAFEAEPDAAS